MTTDDPPVRPLRRVVVGISGASGAIYAVRLVEALLADPANEVHVVATSAGMRVMADEAPIAAPGGAIGSGRAEESDGGDSPDARSESRAPSPVAPARFPLRPYLNLTSEQASRLRPHPCADIGAGPASGTFRTHSMIVVPCSANTLASIAHGLAGNLLTRAAAVTLKEGRPLLLVPRETPLTLIDLRNMTAAAEAGAIVLPASPGFYHRPTSIEDLVAFVVQKIFDRLGLEYPAENAVRWGEAQWGERRSR